MADWFDSNAPQKDWFDSNAPGQNFVRGLPPGQTKPPGVPAPQVNMQQFPPTPMQQFGQAAMQQIKALPGGIMQTVMHPLDSSPFGQDTRYGTDPAYAAQVDKQMQDAFDQSPAQLAGGMAGQGVNAGLMTLAGEGLSAMPYGRIATGAKGAFKGAAKTFVTPSGVGHGFYTMLPAPLTGAAIGGIAGHEIPFIGPTVGSAIGAAYPIMRGAVQGAREALSFDPNASALAGPESMPAPPPVTFRQPDTPVAPPPVTFKAPAPAAQTVAPPPVRWPLRAPEESALIPQPLVPPKTMAAGASAAPPEGSIVVPPIEGAPFITPRYQEIGAGQAQAVAQAAQAKDLQFAQHLQSKGFTPDLVSKMTPEDMNVVRQEVNRTYGKKYAVSKRGHDAFKQDVIDAMNSQSAQPR